MRTCLRLLFFVMTIAGVSRSSATIIAGPNMNPNNGHIYYLLDRSSWSAAEAEAVSMGGHLATIANAVENSWVLNTFGASSRTLWIGLNDRNVEASFVWSSGSSSTYRNWYPGEPNNVNGAEDCVQMYSQFYGGRWNDLCDCVADAYGVVEKYTAQVNTIAVGMGSVVKEPDLANYTPGSVVTISAIPSPGWVFVGWSGDASGNVNPLNLNVDGDKNISATFVQHYSLDVSAVGQGAVSRVPDQPLYGAGATVVINATASQGWHLDGWSGDASGTANPLNLLIDGNKVVTATFKENVYTWNRTGTASWGTASNWTPARNTPLPTDKLIFNGGGLVAVTGAVNQTVRQLVISNNSTVALQLTGASVLALDGDAGVGLDIEASSTLLLNGTNPIQISLGTSAAGRIRGAVTVSGAGHRMYAARRDALTFESGSELTLTRGFSGNFFGTGVAPGALNSVTFQSGSKVTQDSGGDIFGANAPNAVVRFEAGSLYRLTRALTPSWSGRTYANFEQEADFVNTPTGTGAWSVDSLTVSSGTLNLSSVSGGGTIRGALSVGSGATLDFRPPGPRGVAFNGTAVQSINVAGTFSTNANTTITVDNPAGIALLGDWAFNGNLSFVRGNVVAGQHTLAIGASGSVAGASQSTGWVVGSLRRNVAAGSSTIRFDVGDTVTHSPVTVAMNEAATAFDLTAYCETTDHPNLASSDLKRAKSVNRYWSLAPAVTPTFTDYDATFTYASADLDPFTNQANLTIRRYSGDWSWVKLGVRAQYAVQGVGITEFGDFALGEPVLCVDGDSTTVDFMSSLGLCEYVGVPDATSVKEPKSPNCPDLYCYPEHECELALCVDLGNTSDCLHLPLVCIDVPFSRFEYVPVGPMRRSLLMPPCRAQLTIEGVAIDRGIVGVSFIPVALPLLRNGMKTGATIDYATAPGYVWNVESSVTTDNTSHLIFGYTASDLRDGVSARELAIYQLREGGWTEVATEAQPDSSRVTIAAPLPGVYALGVHDVSAVTEDPNHASDSFSLRSGAPNPFNPRTTIRFELPASGHVRLAIYSVAGQLIRTLVDGDMSAGANEADWDGRDASGGAVASGVYFARLETVSGMRTVKLALTR